MKQLKPSVTKALVFFSFLLCASFSYGATVIKYVTVAGKGSKNGINWDNAYDGTNLQTAINSLATTGGEVWVAKGTYYPTLDSNAVAAPTDARTKSFTLKKNVKIYGGFAGTETLLSARAHKTNLTILSGDLGTIASTTDNAYHVVLYNRVADTTALLDGFTITGGNANTTGFNRDIGAGIYTIGGVFSNCDINNNVSITHAGGAYIDGGIIRNCSIYSNKVLFGVLNIEEDRAGGGGGLYLASTSAPYSASNCIIYGNVAPSGAGVMIQGDKIGRVQNCLIYNNNSIGTKTCVIGGGACGGAGIYTFGRVILSSCAIFNNTSSFMSGGIFVNFSGVKIINCTIANNKTLRSGESVNQQLYLHANTLDACSIYNSIITSTTSNGDDVIKTLTYEKSSCLINCFANGYNLSSIKDLKFDSPTTFIGISSNATEAASISSSNWNMSSYTSPLFNAGNNSVLTKDLSPFDAANNPRVVMGAVDIGAFEYFTRRYVTQTGSGTKDGSSWANAFPSTSLQTAINKGFGEVFVAAGTYSPTNNASGIASTGTDAIFNIPKDVMLFGGFRGNEVNSSDRVRFDKNGDGKIQPWEFKDSTILSGTFGSKERYYERLIVFSNDNDTARLDGFVLKYALRQAIGVKSAYSRNKILNCIVSYNGETGYNLPNIHLRGNSYMFGTYVTQSLNYNAVYTNETPLIDSCLITYSNTFSVGGPGATIKNSIIHHSKYCSWISGTFTFDRCVISDISDTAITSTGLGYMYNTELKNCNRVGILAHDGFTMVNSVITNTTTGISVKSGAYKIINSTFAQNGIDVDCPTTTGSDSYITNTILADNSTIGANAIVKNCAIKGGYAKGDSIITLTSSTDAKFVLPTTFSGYTTITSSITAIQNANWSLQSTSPLIDKGTSVGNNLVDINKNPRPTLGKYDIGAYEVQSIASPLVVPSVTVADATPLKPGTATISWINSAADGYIVFVKEGATGVPAIIDGVDYSASTIFTNGSTPDNSWYCVYNGTGTTVTVSNLTAGNWHSIVVLPYTGKNYKIYAKYLVEEKNVVRFYEKSIQTITFNAPDTIKGQTSFIPDASTTSNCQLTFTSSVDTIASPNGNMIRILNPGKAIITASQAGNAQYFPATSVAKTIVFGKSSQKITFTMPTKATYGDVDVALTATATSSLPVTFSSSNASVARVINGVLSIVGAGTATIIANQAGNNYYTAANSVSFPLTVSPKTQSISIDSIYPVTCGIDDFAAVVKTESNGASTLTSSNSAVASIVNNKIHVVGAGLTTITATQAGTINYLATSTTRKLLVNKGSQTISFYTLPVKSFGASSFALEASSTAKLPITFASSDPAIASIAGNIVTIKKAGTVQITASQAGSENYDSATAVTRSLTVLPADQTITFAALPAVTYGEVQKLKPTVSSTSNLPVTLTSYNTAVAKIVNDSIVIVGAGSTVITASQNGNVNYNQASQARQTLVVAKRAQSITFTKTTKAVFGAADIAVNATASSQLPVSVSSSDQNIVSIINNKLHILSAGSVVISVSQAGNDNFMAVDSVFTLVVAKSAQTISFVPIAKAVFGDADFAPSVKASSELECLLSTSNDTVAKIVNGKIHIIGVGSVRITASQAGNSNYLAAKDSTISFDVQKAAQSINFLPLALKTYGTTAFALEASSTAKLPITFASSDPAIASIIGNTVTIKKAGTVQITASQTGSKNYDTATAVTRSLTVLPADQIITFDSLATQAYTENLIITPKISISSGRKLKLTSYNLSVAKILADNTIAIVGAGKTIITASQEGDSCYAQAAPVQRELEVTKLTQSLTFDKTTEAVYGQTDIALNAASSSKLKINVSTSDQNVVSIVNNKLHIVGAGTAIINLSQEGSNIYSAKDSSFTIIVKKAKQKILFSPIANRSIADGDVFPVVKATSNLPVTLVSKNKNTVIENGVIKIVSTGKDTIVASQEGNENYEAASDSTVTFEVRKATQSVVFNTLPTITYGATKSFVLDGFATSGLKVNYVSNNEAVAKIKSDTVFILGTGNCVITANQAGSKDYEAAGDKQQVLTVLKMSQTLKYSTALPDTITFGEVSNIVPQISSDRNLTIELISQNESVARVQDGKIVITGAGTTIISARQAGNDTVLAATNVDHRLVVLQKIQSITVTANAKVEYGSKDFAIVVESSSKVPVSLQSQTPNIVQIVNGKVQVVGVGTATIRLTQEAVAGYKAIDTTITIVVEKAKDSITFTALENKLLGQKDFTLYAESKSGTAVKFYSSNSTVASVLEDVVTINGAGSCTISAIVKDSKNFQGDTVKQSFTVSAMDVLKMPSYQFSRDTAIDLNALRLNTDDFKYTFVSAKNNAVTIVGSQATIVPNRSKACWTGVDTLWFKAVNNKTKSDSVSFAVKVTRTRYTDQIGMVTTDSLTGKYNIIAWEPKQKAATSKWTVYRRGESLSQWDSLGQVAATDTAVFVDKAVNTKQQAYQYALVTKDEYGCKSPMSAPHTTMHLKTGVSLQNYPQLWWSAYQGVEVETYIIYRENVQTKQFEEIGSTFLSSFTDPKPNGTNNYRVAIKFASWIKPSKLKTDTGPFSQSFSNMSEASLVDVAMIDTLVEVVAWPNPATEVLHINATESIESIEFVSTDGRVVKQINSLGSTETVVSVKDLAKGFFSVVVTTAKDTKTISIEVQ